MQLRERPRGISSTGILRIHPGGKWHPEKGTFRGVRRRQGRIHRAPRASWWSGRGAGKLFERPGNSSSNAAPLALNESRTHAIVASRGRHLVDHYWGRDVAFLHDDAARSSWVLCDPSGGLPCLTVRFGGVRIYFSAMADIQQLGLGPFDVNWGYLIAWICVMRGHSHSTALSEVSQVLAESASSCTKTSRPARFTGTRCGSRTLTSSMIQTRLRPPCATASSIALVPGLRATAELPFRCPAASTLPLFTPLLTRRRREADLLPLLPYRRGYGRTAVRASRRTFWE